MNLDYLLKNFDLIAEMPGGVARLRELILELAVSGKLVKQDPKDESSSVLFQRICKERQNLVHQKKIKNFQRDSIDYQNPYILPDSWSWVLLGEIGDWGSGSTPARGNPDFYGGEMPWFKSGELNDNTALAESEETVTDKAIKAGSFRVNKPGDVLLAMYGATIGKVAILATSAVTNQAVCGCTAFKGVMNRYLYNYLVSQRRNFHLASEGGAQPNISKIKIVNYPFPLPPFAEQKRIVAKVDELMALCDQLDAQHAERHQRRQTLTRAAIARFTADPTIANMQYLFDPDYALDPEDLRKVILTLAVRGKLVRQIKEEGTGETCLKRLGIEFDTYAERAVLPDVSLPKSWAFVRLDDIAVITGGVTLGRKLNSKNPVTLPYLRVANVKRGEIDLSIMKEVTISEDEITRFSLKKNDLLLTEGGDWDKVGRAAVWKGQIDPCLHQNHVFRVRMRSEEIQPYWFERYMNSSIGRAYFEGASKQTTNLASINMRQVRSCPVPFPPLAEQNRVMIKVAELLGSVDCIEKLRIARTNASYLLLQTLFFSKHIS